MVFVFCGWKGEEVGSVEGDGGVGGREREWRGLCSAMG